FLRQKTELLMQQFKADSASHLGKTILHILENLPRDDLFQISTEELSKVILSILSIRERRVTRLIVRKDAYGRFYSCLIYI
ncbi:hypothetical protein ABTH46_20080, partial [Acinetobacter baumannii]